MAGRIPQDFIDNLLARTDIVEIINQRVPLKKQGREYTACCPFHGEKTPSFTVSPEKQFYHCFGCGAHGTAIGFLMEYDNLDFVSAIETLATAQGIDVPREGLDNSHPRENLAPIYKLLEDAARYYQQNLKRSQVAIDYLKKRGISGEIAKAFMIGYAEDAWDSLLSHLSGQYNPETLLKAGMLSRNDSGRIYDKFRQRIMFPIRDRRGEVIAFGGRVLEQGEPKYLNSPETPVFNKSATLYGLYEATRANSRLESLIVVEGYMDVVALAQYGIRNAVATLGTATTTEHIRQLFRAVHRIVFCFDADRAGRDAAWRALGNAMATLRDGLEIDFLFLPEGEDPDSFIRREGAPQFQQQLETALPLSKYFLETLRSRHDLTSFEGRTRLMLEAKKTLEPLKEGLLRSQIEAELERITHIPREKQSFAPPAKDQRIRSGLHVTPMRLVIAGLLQNPTLAALAFELYDPMLNTLPGHDLLQTILETLRSNPELRPAMLLERFRGSPQEPVIKRLAGWQPPSESDDQTESWQPLIRDAFGQLLKQAREQKVKELLERESLGHAPLTPQEKEQLITLLRQ